MTTTTTTGPFWVDEHYDRENASDGISRYGYYLRDRVREFAHCDDAGDFAALAWKTATGPVMAPGYVRTSWPRIEEVTFGYHEDGLLARVKLVAPLPEQLQRLFGYQTVTREDGNYWEPGAETLARRPALLTTVTSLHVIPRDRIPAVEDPTKPDTETAKNVVMALVMELNEHLRPIMQALESR